MWEIVKNVLLLALGFVMLAKGADWFVDGASGVATKLKIPQIVIGLTIVAMGTSAPEAAVSISSALKGNVDVAIGNVVGSNILNILIILGISSIITALAVGNSTIKIDIPVMLGASALLFLLGLDGAISLVDGLLFLVSFVAYLAYLFIIERKKKHDELEIVKPSPLWKSLIFMVVGLVIIILGSNFSVDSATFLARKMGVSEKFIGLTVIALGTSLPELFTSVSAALKNNADIAIGNIVGSNIFNILFVLGLTSIIKPVPFVASFRVDALVSILAGIILWLSCVFSNKVGRIVGILMLICYAGYFVYLIAV